MQHFPDNAGALTTRILKVLAEYKPNESTSHSLLRDQVFHEGLDLLQKLKFSSALNDLFIAGVVDKLQGVHKQADVCWRITPLGVELLSNLIGEAEFIQGMKAKPGSFVTFTDDKPVNEDEEPEAAIALLCVDEAELDRWWDALDVEAKADAFTQYSLGNDGRNSHIYIEPNTRIKLTDRATGLVSGTIGSAPAPETLLARPGVPPEAPRPMDLLCPACGKRDDDWRRGPEYTTSLVMLPGQRHAVSNDGSGPFVYTHACQTAAPR